MGQMCLEWTDYRQWGGRARIADRSVPVAGHDMSP